MKRPTRVRRELEDRHAFGLEGLHGADLPVRIADDLDNDHGRSETVRSVSDSVVDLCVATSPNQHKTVYDDTEHRPIVSEGGSL
jgi:hypothetical protein